MFCGKAAPAWKDLHRSQACTARVRISVRETKMLEMHQGRAGGCVHAEAGQRFEPTPAERWLTA